MIKVEKPGDIVNGVDNVNVPDIQQAFQKKEEFKFAVNNVGRPKMFSTCYNVFFFLLFFW